MDDILDLPDNILSFFDSFPDIIKSFLFILFTIGIIVTLIKFFK